MKILVMGSGAVGGYYGALLARNGQDVTFVARGAHLDAIRADGLRVECATAGDFVVDSPVTERPDGSWIADLVLFSVKSYHNPVAMKIVAPAVGQGTAILTLQNGIGSGGELATSFGPERILVGAAYLEARMTAPGVIAQLGGPARIVFGEPDGAVTDRAGEVRDVLAAAGIDVELSPDVMKELWHKLIFICGLSGMTCICRGSFAEVMDTPETTEVTRRVVEEATAVARATGVDVDRDIVDSAMSHFHREKDSLISSMHADLLAGRPLEVAMLNGAVARLGGKAGVPTPVNDLITACLSIADGRARAETA